MKHSHCALEAMEAQVQTRAPIFSFLNSAKSLAFLE
jgi:hypothetical protein